MAPMAPDVVTDAGWLASRRWFRHKAQPVESIRVADRAGLGDGCSLLVLAARLASGEEVRYFAPATDVAGEFREPSDGDGAWRAMVGWLEAGERPVASDRGAFVPHPGPVTERLAAAGPAAALAERRLGAQQSNTSVQLGDRLLL